MPIEDYIVTIGLEVHCQINSESKMFCACQTGFGFDPNTNTCPVCLGLPGALPVLNQHAIEQTILAGMLLDCETPEISKWDRKNYFYPDMPKNYQLTQFDQPLCIGGGVPLYDVAYPKEVQKNIPKPGKVVKLTRIHLEEDVAKSTHHSKNTTIDFNRAGTPLMEIVSDPDIDTADEAYAYLKSLQQILIYGEISDADMEKGQMRCDVNISLRPHGQEELGEKVELKNLNSISAVRRSINYEIERQAFELDQGIAQIQSTRRWNDGIGETELMRTKEDAHDYRYFPEPDLLPIRTATAVEKMRPFVPELPHEKRDRFVAEYKISEYDAAVIASERALADFFESAAKPSKAPKKVANWLINNLLSKLNEAELAIGACPLPAATLTQLVDLIEAGTISNNQGKELFEVLWSSPEKDPAATAKEMGFEPADNSLIDGLIDEAIAANPEKVAEIQGGNDKLLNWLTGQVMKASRGKANPKLVTDALRAKLIG
ncbi:Asp-tRNA(Asn)/Glu-tRNA(Gln) amidotransferase subunit GatB [Persicirhabdus sediminis]|uniref:Aspartyl/glutamyl-tRNA(Asn/Gln) amidotransferase subunit B n=1 Tax=Persicirhabdus sediminis TaxID=454144 RepID=A0A8J7MFH0_9BACT|nr:Asp-tRNA(Asn)/Glu-tRNA(Gln) amidotransferase subunit GatB [Persicirhabdus sediminis]MBK1791795.1 Asp-tRNA(Asn)/Glu-tRNA(Gln) amidotransferase subunit GatB [Persicirhabdus sediminis]